MAANHSTREILVEEGKYYWDYRGTKAQLLTAGLLPDEPMPGELGATRKHTYKTKTPDGRRCTVTIYRKTIVPLRYNVTVWRTDEEVRAIDAREELREAQANEKRAMWTIPNSADDFRIKLNALILAQLLPVRKYLVQGLGGYRLAPSAVNKLTETVRDAIKETLDDGKVYYNAEVQAWEIAKIKAETAKADPAAKRFIDTVIGGAHK